MKRKELNSKELDLKKLDDKQLKVIKKINLQIIEYQTIFEEQPAEILVTKNDYNTLAEDNTEDKYKYLLLGNIKIYHI